MDVREICFVLCSVAHLFSSSAMVLVDSMKTDIQAMDKTNVVVEEQKVEEPEIIYSYDIAMDMHDNLQLFLNTCPVICHTEPTDLENYSCLMYATESLGCYYITAYNHLETGSKLTASGKTCHEGTVTTCAADPRYHKFGEYLEIDGRLYVVEDTGSAVKKRHIDLYFANYKSMARYGSNYQEIYKVSWPFGKPKQN